jgi:hypothetical protein
LQQRPHPDGGKLPLESVRKRRATATRRMRAAATRRVVLSNIADGLSHKDQAEGQG